MMFPLASNAAPALFLALVLAGPAAAQGPSPAEHTAEAPGPAADKKVFNAVLTQFKVFKDAQGREQFAEANSVKPGDIIEYRVVYTNNAARPIAGLTAELPIPEGLEYLPGSARPGPAKVEAATRGGEFGPEPLSRTVNGRTEPVPYNEYRRLRWALGVLPAKGMAAVSARARVETAAAPTARSAAPASPAAASLSR